MVRRVGRAQHDCSQGKVVQRLMNPLHYGLRCQGRGEMYEDGGLILECSVQHEPALLVGEYRDERLEPDVCADRSVQVQEVAAG